VLILDKQENIICHVLMYVIALPLCFTQFFIFIIFLRIFMALNAGGKNHLPSELHLPSRIFTEIRGEFIF